MKNILQKVLGQFFDIKVGKYFGQCETFWKEIYEHHPDIYFHIFQESPERYKYDTSDFLMDQKYGDSSTARKLQVIYSEALTRLYILTEYPYAFTARSINFVEDSYKKATPLKTWIWINKHKETYWLL